MEVIIFAISFIFSFVIFILGVLKNSWTLSLSGSLLLMIFSIVVIGMGIQNVEANVLRLSINDTNGNNNSYIINSNSVGGINDPFTMIFSFIMFIFSCIFVLYSLMYLRNKPPES